MVGQRAIYLDQVEPGLEMAGKTLVNYRRDRFRGLAMQELVTEYLKDHKIEVTAAELAQEKADIAKSLEIAPDQVDKWMAQMGMTDRDLADQLRRRKLKSPPSQQAVEAFIQANPDCFNGTSVHAAHIVLECWPLTSTVQQDKVRARLQQLAADIQAGKITFADAARKYSTDRTAAKGGDLGEVRFEGMMVPTIARPLLKAKPGEMLIARSEYGYHLLKVFDRKQGAAPATTPATQPAATEPGESTSQPADAAPDLRAEHASRAMSYLTQMEVLSQVMDKCRIQVMQPELFEYAAVSATMPATAPAGKPATPPAAGR